MLKSNVEILTKTIYKALHLPANTIFLIYYFYENYT
jgi:hypothetical protein